MCFHCSEELPAASTVAVSLYTPLGGAGAPFLHLEQLLSLHGGCAVVPGRGEGGSPTGDQDVGLKGGEVQDGPTVDLDVLGQ